MVKYKEFPVELLQQSPQERLDFFKSPGQTFMHRNLKIAFTQTLRTILEPAGASIILIIGPSGSGKTTLLELLKKKILERSVTEMEKNPGWVPIISVEAPAPGKGTFRWKNFYRIILEAVDEPAIAYKIDYNDSSFRRNKNGQLEINAKQVTEDALRLAMEKALIYRKPYTLAVDEFQHIGKMAREELLQAHMDCVKSAVNITKVPWAGFGTYQLLNFLELSPQLSRRTKVIHLPRYNLAYDKDINEFKDILNFLLQRMPIPQVPTAEELWEFCYERSIGNVGTLIDWMTEAYALALSKDATSLTLEHLELTAKLSSECEQMLLEAIDGETKLTDSTENKKRLRVLLGLEKGKDNSNNNSIQKDKTSTKTNNKTKPFNRNPKRDSVGDL